MNKWNCYMLGQDIDRAKTIALGVATNPYFELIGKRKDMTNRVIMSTESYNAVNTAGILVYKEGPYSD